MRWAIDEVSVESWQALLAALGPSPVEQARAYEALRERLLLFFRSRAAPATDRLADEVLNRLADKLASGIEVHRSVTALALGMARLVWLESRRQEVRDTGAAEQLRDPVAADDEQDAWLAAIEDCLGRLESGDREQLLDYHRLRGRAKIAARKAMAERAGTTVNALRLRMMRLRRRLSECIEQTRATWDGSERHFQRGGSS